MSLPLIDRSPDLKRLRDEGYDVDIATEFSNLMVTQRAYSADAKIITTADQMLQDLINAKQ